jgi:hypothetical protein
MRHHENTSDQTPHVRIKRESQRERARKRKREEVGVKNTSIAMKLFGQWGGCVYMCDCVCVCQIDKEREGEKAKRREVRRE